MPIILEELVKGIISGDEEGVKKIAEKAVELGIDPLVAIKKGIVKGINVMGEKFHKFEVFLPEVLLAADAAKAGIEVLEHDWS